MESELHPSPANTRLDRAHQHQELGDPIPPTHDKPMSESKHVAPCNAGAPLVQGGAHKDDREPKLLYVPSPFFFFPNAWFDNFIWESESTNSNSGTGIDCRRKQKWKWKKQKWKKRKRQKRKRQKPKQN